MSYEGRPCDGCDQPMATEEEQMTVWARAPLGLTALHTHRGACEEAALVRRKWRRAVLPPPKGAVPRSEAGKRP